MTQRPLAAVVLAVYPENALGIQGAPERGEGIGEAEIDAAKLFAGGAGHQLGRGFVVDDAASEIVIDEPLQRLEGAFVLLTVPGPAHGAPVLFEALGLDARDLAGRDVDVRPVGAATGPGVVKEAALAERRGQADQAAVGNDQHRPDGAVELVWNAGGLVNDEQGDAGVAADRFLLARETDDAAAVLQAQLVGGLLVEEGRAELFVKTDDHAEQ